MLSLQPGDKVSIDLDYINENKCGGFYYGIPIETIYKLINKYKVFTIIKCRGDVSYTLMETAHIFHHKCLVLITDNDVEDDRINIHDAF